MAFFLHPCYSIIAFILVIAFLFMFGLLHSYLHNLHGIIQADIFSFALTHVAVLERFVAMGVGFVTERGLPLSHDWGILDCHRSCVVFQCT